MERKYMAIPYPMMPSDLIDYLGTWRLFTSHVFEATGVYSRRLQAFFEDNSYAYTRLNPLESKKQLDSLRVRKTDKIDAEKLANQSYCAVKKTSPVIEEVKYYAGELLRLSEYRQGVLEEMVTLA